MYTVLYIIALNMTIQTLLITFVIHQFYTFKYNQYTLFYKKVDGIVDKIISFENKILSEYKLFKKKALMELSHYQD